MDRSSRRRRQKPMLSNPYSRALGRPPQTRAKAACKLILQPRKRMGGSDSKSSERTRSGQRRAVCSPPWRRSCFACCHPRVGTDSLIGSSGRSQWTATKTRS